MEISEYDPLIVWFDNALPKDFCRKLIRRFNKDERVTNGITLAGYDPDMKQSLDLHISSLEDWRDEDQVFFNSLSKHLKEYTEYMMESFGLPVVINEDSGYQIQKTKPGGFYHWHHDSVSRAPLNYRMVTYLWYLNSCKDGETEFTCGESVEPTTGRLLLFPATWDRVHRGTPPKTVKYISTGWLYCLPRDEQEKQVESPPSPSTEWFQSTPQDDDTTSTS